MPNSSAVSRFSTNSEPVTSCTIGVVAKRVTSSHPTAGETERRAAEWSRPSSRDPEVLRPIAGALGVPLAPGRFLFATVHRAENREPGTMARWSGLLGAVAAPDRPVVLALHPGTRVALEAAGLALP